MQLSSKGGVFGRHESFPLRFGWITKALEALPEHPNVFNRDDATVILGVGKNMVASIRHWMIAARILELNPSTDELMPTPLAKIIFSENGDPCLEDEATIWLLHWLLATNVSGSTSIYWFFNHFHKRNFDNTDVATGLIDFVKHQFISRVSPTTLKRDSQLVLRMYSRTSNSTRVSLEDSMDSPLSLLNLIERNGSNAWQSMPSDRRELPPTVLAFAVAQLFEHVQTNQLAVADLMYSDKGRCAPGAVFRLTEDSLIEKLEDLCTEHSNSLRLDNTAGVFQLYKFASFNSIRILRSQYASTSRRVA